MQSLIALCDYNQLPPDLWLKQSRNSAARESTALGKECEGSLVKRGGRASGGPRNLGSWLNGPRWPIREKLSGAV